jgi:multisubunit Na+/H+ antiporter MnhE subunit
MARAAATAMTLLCWWGLLFALYLVCISTVSPLEIVVGAAAALLGAVAAEAVRRAERPPTDGARRLTAAAAAFPATLLRETGQLGAAVIRALRGRPGSGREVTFRLEPGVSPALAAVLLSASPGSCVIDIQDADGRDEDSDGPTRPGDDARGGSAGGRAPGGTLLTVHLLAAGASPVEAALPGERVG